MAYRQGIAGQRRAWPCGRHEAHLGRIAHTRSAYCSTPYSGIEPLTYGTLSYTPQQIEDYMRLATEHGFDIACHAIGDEANTIALNAVAATHAHGSIEHAQMLKPVDIPRFAELGLTASIQPQHAMDDRDVITRFWANPAGIPYPFRALHDAGTTLRMGSDAPVAPLGPVAGHFRRRARHRKL